MKINHRRLVTVLAVMVLVIGIFESAPPRWRADLLLNSKCRSNHLVAAFLAGWGGTRSNVVDILGHYVTSRDVESSRSRSANALRALMQISPMDSVEYLFDPRYSFVLNDPKGEDDGREVRKAVIAIGEPALNYILSDRCLIDTNNSTDTWSLILLAIRGIEARSLIENHIRNESRPPQAAYLRAIESRMDYFITCARNANTGESEVKKGGLLEALTAEVRNSEKSNPQSAHTNKP